MNKTLLDFLKSQNIAVFTTMLLDGGPHSATMYYAFDHHSTKLYFVADINDMKCETLSEQDETFGSVVVGTDPDEWKSVQMRGSVKLVPIKEEEYIIKQHLVHSKHFDTFISSEDRVVIEFTPSWWRFTDAGNGSISESD